MLKRVLSAIMIVLIFVPLLMIGEFPFAIFMAILGMMSAYELLKIKDKDGNIPILMKILVYIAVCFMVLYNSSSVTFNYTIDYKIMSILVFMFIIPIVLINDNKRYSVGTALYLLSATLFLGFSFNLMVIFRNYDLNYLIYLLLIAVITDVFAYTSGKLIGRNKMTPKISPNKTWEGAIVGTFMGVFVASSFYHVFINHNYSLVILILITIGLSIVGQIGDLVFSMIKRHYKEKDFSSLIPGHGGVLDRFDSIIFIALAFILVMGIM